MEKFSCPFDFKEFSSRDQLDYHLAKFHTRQDRDIIHPQIIIASSGSYLSLSDNSPEPVVATKEGLSAVLKNVKLPQNPLSEIGEISEPKLLRISNSPNITALYEVLFKQLRLSGKGLSDFDSNERFSVSSLSNLKTLDLSANYIACLSGVAKCVNLSYLNISKNFIENLQPLSSLLKLTTLKASDNKIKEILPLCSCKKIIKLKLSNNKIFCFERTLKVLSAMPKLINLSLAKNPCVAKTKDAKEKIVNLLNLHKFDKEDVEDVDKNEPVKNLTHRVSFVRKKLANDLNCGNIDPVLKQELNGLQVENVILKEELKRVKEQIDKVKQSSSILDSIRD